MTWTYAAASLASNPVMQVRNPRQPQRSLAQNPCAGERDRMTEPVPFDPNRIPSLTLGGKQWPERRRSSPTSST
ncbi:MAG TPA: hypothetical protein VGG10_18680 [Rhizomicrobium sp.]|jgi:hypothetical protein